MEEPRTGPMLLTQFKEAVKDILDSAGGDGVWERKWSNIVICFPFLVFVEAIQIASMYF